MRNVKEAKVSSLLSFALSKNTPEIHLTKRLEFSVRFIYKTAKSEKLMA